MPRFGHEQDEPIDPAIELLPVLPTQQRLKVADSRFGDHAELRPIHAQQDIPSSQVAALYRRLKSMRNRGWHARQEPIDQAEVRCIPQLPAGRVGLNTKLEPENSRHARSLQEIGIWVLPELVSADGLLR